MIIPVEVKVIDSLQLRVLKEPVISATKPLGPEEIYEKILVSISRCSIELKSAKEGLKLILPQLSDEQILILRRDLANCGLLKPLEDLLYRNPLGDNRYI